MEFLFWIIFTYVLLSFIEWYIHKYHMHRKGFFHKYMSWLFYHHQLFHHPTYLKNFDKANPEEHKEIGVMFPLFTILLISSIPLILIGFFISLLGAIILL